MFKRLFSRKASLAAQPARKRPPSGRRRPPSLSTKLADQEDKWNAIADTIGFVVAVYLQGEETIVDVLHVHGAYLNDRHTLVLEVAAPSAIKNREMGDRLEWTRDFELPIDALRRFEPLHPAFSRDGPHAYHRALERARTAAETL